MESGEIKDTFIMRKFFIIAIAVFTALAVSCNKDINPEQNNPEENTVSIVKSFKVVMPETKAYMGDNSDTGNKLVLFSDGDEITIFANTSGNAYTGTYSISTGEFTTEITEEADAEETNYYAVYPAKYKNNNGNFKDWLFTSGGIIAAQDALNYSNIAAIPNGIDETISVMLAKVNESGALEFRYGCAFLKLQVPAAGIKSISFDTSNKSARYGGRPTYSIENETIISDHQGSQKTITVVSETAFQPGVDYFIPIIPKASSNGIVKITFKTTSESRTIETPSDENNTFYKAKMTPGFIYNLGCPPVSFSPEVVADDVTIEKDDTSGDIDYQIINPAVDGTISVAVNDSYDNTITGLVLSDAVSGKIHFTCDANNTSDIRYANVIITYSYGDTEITTDALIIQKGGSIDYVWDFSSEEWQDALKGSAPNACAEENGNANVSNWSVSYNMLTYTSGSSNGKWSTNGYIQPNGAGSANARVFSFTAPFEGTVSVKVSNTSDSEATDRYVTVSVNGGTPQSIVGGAPSSSPVEVEFTVSNGEIKIYPTGKGLRFYKIEFHSN